jgi:hypothetical protein
MKGSKSWDNVSEQAKALSLHVLPSNSVSEANHASSTVGLKLSGTICLDHICAEGQTRHNNDFGHDHEVLVRGKGSSGKSIIRNLGTYHNICNKLKSSIIQAAQENANATRKRFDSTLARQAEGRRRKEEIAMQKKIDAAQEDYIVGLYFYKMYTSPCCWKTVHAARTEYGLLGSEAAKLQAVKEQHLIHTLGLGWEEAHHPWTKNGQAYSSRQLLDHLCNVVIPLATKLNVPDDAPAKLPTAPDLCTLGTLSAIGDELKTKGLAQIAEFNQKGRTERDRREEEGRGDRWAEKQSAVIPEINNKFVGFKIDIILFNYIHDQGLNWCHGEVIAIKNAKRKTVKVR